MSDQAFSDVPQLGAIVMMCGGGLLLAGEILPVSRSLEGGDDAR